MTLPCSVLWERLNAMEQEDAKALASETLANANFEDGLESLNSEERAACLWLEALYDEGVITYGQLYELCFPKRARRP